MKFLIKFYYLPFLAGIIVSVLLWIGSYDAKFRSEGMAKLNYSHAQASKASEIFWKNAIYEILEKFNNEKVTIYVKRRVLRFKAKDHDMIEITKSYHKIKNEIQKYKLDYIKFAKELFLQRNKFIENIENKEKLAESYVKFILDQEFLLDLKTNQVIIRNNQFIYITILISFLLSIILYNLKNYNQIFK